jgi:peptidoglycan/LPS O-acetylase OafA/YrhL
MDKGLSLIWFLGALLASCHNFNNKHLNSSTLLASICTMAIGLFGFVQLGYNTAILLFAISFYVVMLHRNENLNFINRTFPISKFFADYSYSLYLTHYSLISFITAVFPMNFGAKEFLLIFVILNFFAFGFASVFERDLIKRMKHN